MLIEKARWIKKKRGIFWITALRGGFDINGGFVVRTFYIQYWNKKGAIEKAVQMEKVWILLTEFSRSNRQS